ncbi:energy transducer TonB [Sandaracinobacter sp. RS1-74]|uniref:energy transducer TonB family protein n=1 Tax=Sandaracinobacteroides sayramensis TaxID=2913411 RepID=UPI001EDAA97C|nr:energy transducer TonB [Sandaracinobacteroides sayramensis]MCG2842825.1 energy transducer TonB [Sandaracinobacteroides sayramensis]
MPERFLGGFLSLSLHLAAGLALLTAWKEGTPLKDPLGGNEGSVLVVELIPLDREDMASERQAARDQEAMEPIPQRAPPVDRGGEGDRQPVSSAAAGPESRLPRLAAETRADSRAMAELPSAEVLAYRQRLESHLARYRLYPASAREGGREGVVMLHFEMTHDGKVLKAWVGESSGVADIDREAVAAVLRAQPLPPFPQSWPGQLDIILPVSFRLG